MGGLLCLYRCSFWRFFWQRLGPARSRQHPTVHRKVGLGCTNRQLVRGLFSYKNPTHQPGKLNTVQLRVTQRRANFSAGYKRDLALDDKSVSSTAVLDQQALPAGHPPPFKKGGRKLCFCIDWMPRGRRSDFAPNQYVNWVQAQPALLKKVDENFIFAETGC